MDLYPAARRVLLTAYADTDAAIDAINVVDLDHYLLKPWDPPEEKLYPVLDDAARGRGATRTTGRCRETKVVGHRWSARSSEVREFLARNQVPYRWYLSDEPEGQRLLEAAGADGLRLPVVITPDGDALVEPTDAELASRVGLATTPAEDFYDLVVIGGGPAGLGAAVYGASEGLRTVLVERTATGGQAGPELADRELPRLPGRGVRGAADRAGPAAGRQVRRRAAHHARRGRPRGQRLGAHGPVRRRRHASPRTPSSSPPGSPTGSSARPGSTSSPAAGSTTGPRSPRRPPARARTSTSSAARTRPGRPRSTCRGTRKSVTILVRGASLERVDVVLPDPADRGDRQHRGPDLHRGRRRRRAATIWRA